MERHKYDDVWTAVVGERARRRMTAAELARRSGVPKGTIDQYMTGRIVPPYPRVIALAKALDLNVSVWGDIPWFDSDEDAREPAMAAAS